jgi:glycerate dehydrogenase
MLPTEENPHAETELQGTMLDLGSTDIGDLDLSALDRVCAHWTRHAATAPAQTAARIADAQVVVTNKVVIGAAEMDAAARLKLICIAATGTNNVDLDAARERGIAVTHVAGYATPSVVQHVLAIMLGWATRLWEQQQAVQAGEWSRSPHFCLLGDGFRQPMRELAGRRLGIVGYGELGRVLRGRRRPSAWRCWWPSVPAPSARRRTLAVPRVPLTELLSRVDVLSLHCPLTDATRNLIGAEELALLGPDALLINTARGGIVDESALAAALRAGILGAAAVDTLSVEPPPTDHPLLSADIPNLIVTPHAAWATREARQRLLDEVAANIAAFAAGERRNRVV